MTTIRWVTAAGDRRFVKDEQFETKREALRAIAAVQVSTIARIFIPGGRGYAVTVKG